MSAEALLKPCPFCGGTPRVDFSTWESVVSCVKCGAYGTPACTQKEAEAAWNARYSEPPKQGEDTKETDIDFTLCPGSTFLYQVLVNGSVIAVISKTGSHQIRMESFDFKQKLFTQQEIAKFASKRFWGE